MKLQSKITRDLKKPSIMKHGPQIKQIEKNNLKETDAAGREKILSNNL